MKTSDFEFQLGRIYYPRPSVDELLEQMKISTTFIVGRNPFERLGNDLGAVVSNHIFSVATFATIVTTNAVISPLLSKC